MPLVMHQLEEDRDQSQVGGDLAKMLLTILVSSRVVQALKRLVDGAKDQSIASAKRKLGKSFLNFLPMARAWSSCITPARVSTTAKTVHLPGSRVLRCGTWQVDNTKSFSIHQMAEKGRKKPDDIAANYDEFEKADAQGVF